MTQIDVIDTFAHHDVEYEGEKDPGDEGVGVETVLSVCDVTETDEIELLQASAASRIDWEENGPSHETTDKTDSHRDLKVSKQEEAIERVVVEDIAVRDLVEGANPIEHAIGKIWRPFPSKGKRQSCAIWYNR